MAELKFDTVIKLQDITDDGQLKLVYPETCYANFDCAFQPVRSLRGAPKYVWGNLKCSHSGLKTLEGAPQWVDQNVYLSGINSLESLSGIGQKYLMTINGIFICNNTPIVKNVLGLLLVRGLVGIQFSRDGRVERILNKHLADHNLLLCQDELIDAGLEEYAHL